MIWRLGTVVQPTFCCCRCFFSRLLVAVVTWYFFFFFYYILSLNAASCMLFCYMPDFTWNKTTKRKKKKLSDSHCNFTSVMLCKFCTLLPPKPPIRFNDCRSVMPLVFLLSLSLVLLFSLIVSLCDYFNARTHFAVLSSYLLYDRAFTHYLLTPKLVWANFFVSFVFIVIRILCVFVLFSLNSLSLCFFQLTNFFR